MISDDLQSKARWQPGPARRRPASFARSWRLLTTLLVFSAQPTVYGQRGRDLSDLSIEDLMKVEVETVTGASKYQQLVTEAPASVTNYAYVGTRGLTLPDADVWSAFTQDAGVGL